MKVETAIDLSALTPAPFRVSDKHGFCVVRDDPIGDMVCSFSEGQWAGNRADAAFIVLARNAYEIMVSRGWHTRRATTGEWCVFYGTGLATGKILEGPSKCLFCSDDPFSCLIAADEHYRENVDM